MRRAAALLTLLLSTSLVHAKRMPPPPTVASTRLDAKALPAGIKAKGKRVIGAWQFTSPGGKVGHLVLSSTETTTRAAIGPGRKLYAQLYAGTKPKQVRLVQDGFDGCNVALRAAFVQGSPSFDDVDGDGVVEVAFAYDIACDMGEEPTTRKLLVLEGPAKYALRGTSDGAHTPEGFGKEGAIAAWAEARWATLQATAPVVVDP